MELFKLIYSSWWIDYIAGFQWDKIYQNCCSAISTFTIRALDDHLGQKCLFSSYSLSLQVYGLILKFPIWRESVGSQWCYNRSPRSWIIQAQIRARSKQVNKNTIHKKKGVQSYEKQPKQCNLLFTGPLLFIEAAGEDQAFASPFGCCIQEVLLCCYPSLREDLIAAWLGLVQRLETTLHVLSTATNHTGHSNHDVFMCGKTPQTVIL